MLPDTLAVEHTLNRAGLHAEHAVALVAESDSGPTGPKAPGDRIRWFHVVGESISTSPLPWRAPSRRSETCSAISRTPGSLGLPRSILYTAIRPEDSLAQADVLDERLSLVFVQEDGEESLLVTLRPGDRLQMVESVQKRTGERKERMELNRPMCSLTVSRDERNATACTETSSPPLN
jgi:hypothetical protein